MQKIRVDYCGWGQSWPLGVIAGNEGKILFEYSQEAREKNVEFSKIRLPLTAATYGDFPATQLGLPGLIADALPDGWGIRLMDRFFKKNFDRPPHAVTALDRLAFIGSRAMGALSFSPATDLSLTPLDVKLVDLAKEIQLVVADKDTAALRQLILVGGSPHGARPKALVQYDEKTAALSTLPGAAGKPWLVKFPSQREHKEVCAIEQLYAEFARRCHLNIPSTRLFDLGPKFAAFGIERFDRVEDMRVPIHTLAGALNLDFRVPHSDYQTLLRTTRALTLSEAETGKAFERCVFNVVMNNRDDHTKNFSFRMNKAMEWELAPCYDLTYSPGPGGEHQMSVEGEGRDPGKKHLLKLATSNALDATWAQAVIERVVGEATRFKAVAKGYPIRPATRTEIAKAISKNCSRMT